ncbi:MAG: sensor histidine kinase, partial [Planctomycetes bacterium]|nr:sensor histidine kinase [Planctomycetota bacterium]
KLEAPDGLPGLVGDREGLLGVLVNLLDNSLKYADLDQPVELVLDADPARVRFSVRDRGPGIPPAERERIFEPFHRVQDEMTREQPGVGLGLALGRSVAEAHGGALRYTARSGGGSEFVLELPAETKTRG